MGCPAGMRQGSRQLNAHRTGTGSPMERIPLQST